MTYIIAAVCGIGIVSQLITPDEALRLKALRCRMYVWMYGRLHTRFLKFERYCGKQAVLWGRQAALYKLRSELDIVDDDGLEGDVQ